MKWTPATKVVSPIGAWSSGTGLQLTDEDSLTVFQSKEPRLMVVTIEEPPYVMRRCANCSGNLRYEGFAIDLLNSISKVRKFSGLIINNILPISCCRLPSLSLLSTQSRTDYTGCLITTPTNGTGSWRSFWRGTLTSPWLPWPSITPGKTIAVNLFWPPHELIAPG